VPILGVALFDRNHLVVEPTMHAQRLYFYAKLVFATLDEAETKIRRPRLPEEARER
jgi:DNA-binding transcriptional LysR family regulator